MVSEQSCVKGDKRKRMIEIPGINVKTTIGKEIRSSSIKRSEGHKTQTKCLHITPSTGEPVNLNHLSLNRLKTHDLTLKLFD